jgi:hypothetical protein
MEDVLAPAIALPMLALTVGLAWRFTAGFWKTVGFASVVVAGVFLAAIEMSMLLLESDLRQEFVELGGSAWVNIPMFGVIALGDSLAAMVIPDPMEARTDNRNRAFIDKEKVPV